MNKAQALMMTYRQWMQVASEERESDCTPSVYKKCETGIGLRNKCPCCQFVAETIQVPGFDYCYERNTLNLCPMKELWPKGCEEDGSPYYSWRRGENRNSPGKDASIIAAKALELWKEEFK